MLEFSMDNLLQMTHIDKTKTQLCISKFSHEQYLMPRTRIIFWSISCNICFSLKLKNFLQKQGIIAKRSEIFNRNSRKP